MQMTVAGRLAALGITLPKLSPSPGPFVGAIRWGNTVTVSGQVPLQDGKVLMVGLLGDQISLEQGQLCARQALLNALAQLDAVAGGLDRVAGFVRLGGFVAATPEFTRHGAVIDGASHLLMQLFDDKGCHARAAIGVASLPRGVPVEIELTAVLQDRG
jgi:enamine deaminase RidA (YjgF/YER057c/UK114 family)